MKTLHILILFAVFIIAVCVDKPKTKTTSRPVKVVKDTVLVNNNVYEIPLPERA